MLFLHTAVYLGFPVLVVSYFNPPDYYEYDTNKDFIPFNYPKALYAEYTNRNHPMEYIWSGALEYGVGNGKTAPLCLRHNTTEVNFEKNLMVDECQCKPRSGCQDYFINFPKPQWQWNFNGVVKMFRKEGGMPSYWKGTIENAYSGLCLTYSPDAEFPILPSKTSDTPGRIGQVGMMKCDLNNRYQYWMAWVYAGHPTTKILPVYHTHMWPVCSQDIQYQKSKPFQKTKPVYRWRGIASLGRGKPVYFGCWADENTNWTPHPWFFRTPDYVSYFPQEKNNDFGTIKNKDGDIALKDLPDFDDRISMTNNV